MAMTPMMQQYLEIKDKYPDTLLMFRLGDFYELFFDDAVLASKALEITLTGRDAGTQGRVPMCGVPYHAAHQYIDRLVDQGYSVAICEQMEDPKNTKGLVKRDVVRVVTPGTVMRDEGSARRVLCAVVGKRNMVGIAMMDVSTGDTWHTEVPSTQLIEWLVQWRPAELVAYEAMLETPAGQAMQDWSDENHVRVTKRVEQRQALHEAERILCQQYEVQSLKPLDLEDHPVATESLGLLLQYVIDTQKQRLTHIRSPKQLSDAGILVVDYTASRNLELVETTRTRQKNGSLFGLLDDTQTSMGSRLLRTWLERPLTQVSAIEARQEAVAALVEDMFARDAVKALLGDMYDLDRLAGRVSFGSANARDLRAIAQTVRRLPELTTTLRGLHSELLRMLAEGLPNLTSLSDEIEAYIVEQPPVSVRDGGMMQPGADVELDELRTLNSSAKEWLANLEQREREATGIRTLKIGYNKVFGYYIEVSKSNTHLAPDHYERRQTLSTGERYTLRELKEQEARILGAADRAVEREYELFCELRDKVLGHLAQLQTASAYIAEIDVLCSFATVAVRHGFVRPTVTDARGIAIVQGRHPVVEAIHPGSFVPNDVSLGHKHDLMLITGPNMAGKSTYMRQTALIVLMAHVGSFVSAESAIIGIVDRIFTRIGASDDLSGGQSTFMVEMVELAQILRQSTSRSLVLLDEIGRGTSTYDGMSIAESVMEALLQLGRSPLTMFATHYHELTDKAQSLEKAANFSVLVRETPQGISFLHAVVDRPADKSYGIQVARLAGIPASVIARAEELLQRRELGRADMDHGLVEAATAQESGAVRELPLFSWQQEQVIGQLADIDVNQLSPVQALNVLNEFVRLSKEAVSWEKSK